LAASFSCKYNNCRRQLSCKKTQETQAHIIVHPSRACDDFTRRFYLEHTNATNQELASIDFAFEEDLAPEVVKSPVAAVVPAMNSLALSSTSAVVPKQLPSKKELFSKILENEGKILRYAAILESGKKEDQGRKFVISYRLADDTMSIYEPPVRNAGILGGKFMERAKVINPETLSSQDGPQYYAPKDLYIGAPLEVSETAGCFLT
jgi:hypothetical protein